MRRAEAERRALANLLATRDRAATAVAVETRHRSAVRRFRPDDTVVARHNLIDLAKSASHRPQGKTDDLSPKRVRSYLVCFDFFINSTMSLSRSFSLVPFAMLL